MSWILQNKFLVALISATVVISGLLLYFGNKASGRYAAHKEEFDQAAAQVGSYERLALYPSQENLDGKTKAVTDFEDTIGDLKSSFSKFQREKEESVSPAELGNRLIAGNEQIAQRLRDANIKLPPTFYSGFESYTGTLAQSGATTVLQDQLAMVDSVMTDLASARPAEITNLRREPQPEEMGGKFESKPDDVVRPHAFELSFLGTEASARRFLTSLVDINKRFAVIRAIRITSESTAAPKPSSNLFTSPAPAAADPANPFAGGFFGAFGDAFAPTDDAEDDAAAADVDDAAPAEGDDAAAPAAPAPARAPQADGARMLGQVAGNEMLHVFIRFDIMEVLETTDDEDSDES